jgi:hypothetical protein
MMPAGMKLGYPMLRLSVMAQQVKKIVGVIEKSFA